MSPAEDDQQSGSYPPHGGAQKVARCTLVFRCARVHLPDLRGGLHDC